MTSDRIRMGYLERLEKAALDERLFSPGEVSDTMVAHDDWCPMVSGGKECKCVPSIMIIAPDGIRYTVAEDGTITPTASLN